MTATIGQLPAVGSVVSNDQLEVEVAATVASARVTVANLVASIAALIDHGGLVGLGDDDHAQYHNDTRGDARYYTQAQIAAQLANYALLSGGNAFVGAQTIQGNLSLTGAFNLLSIVAGDVGNNQSGQILIVGRNNNAATPAAGQVRIEARDGTGYRLWPDNTGVLRIWTSNPTFATDTSGTVVGAQTSSLDAKYIIAGETSIEDVLAAVQRGAEAVRRFAYKSGAYNGEEFEGVVVDYAPRYGMDRDAEHEAGKSLNMINIMGDLLRAVDNLAQRVAALEAMHAG